MYSIYRRRVATRRKRININRRALKRHCSAERAKRRRRIGAGRSKTYTARYPQATRLPVSRDTPGHRGCYTTVACFFLLVPTTTNRCSIAGGDRLDPATDTRRNDATCSRFACHHVLVDNSDDYGTRDAARPRTSRNENERKNMKILSTTLDVFGTHYTCRVKSVRIFSAGRVQSRNLHLSRLFSTSNNNNVLVRYCGFRN